MLYVDPPLNESLIEFLTPWGVALCIPICRTSLLYTLNSLQHVFTYSYICKNAIQTVWPKSSRQAAMEIRIF
ncbi:hypothetical protein XELAEV_18015634mg [Xenopus laevis]|uniref:Uncharacterized protein n=1 Tax=Xenopus laevis TaxID=8355 RepID=A0A974DKW8_XENLA|nr:hypothetical protein XELAEV_18015634mg [Xenopus laevis]